MAHTKSSNFAKKFCSKSPFKTGFINKILGRKVYKNITFPETGEDSKIVVTKNKTKVKGPKGKYTIPSEDKEQVDNMLKNMGK
tara:strand:+ start:384 stop:632 length:249 start_codon:yes stop_codon:yes gene_type:complete